MSLSHFGSTVLLIEQLELCAMEEQRFIKQYVSCKSMRSALLCSIVDVKNKTLYQLFMLARYNGPKFLVSLHFLK